MTIWYAICGVGLIGVFAVTVLICYACCVAAGRADDWMELENEKRNSA